MQDLKFYFKQIVDAQANVFPMQSTVHSFCSVINLNLMMLNFSFSNCDFYVSDTTF